MRHPMPACTPHRARQPIRDIVPLACGLLLLSSAVALAGGEERLHVALPHGGCSLSLEPDGAGALSYGALPRDVPVAAGTFDFVAIRDRLRRDAWAPGARPVETGELAAVVFGADSRVHFFEDGEYVRTLLVRGWEARVMRGASSAETEAMIGSACGFGGTESGGA